MKDRLLKLIETLDLSVSGFSKLIGAKDGTTRMYTARGSKPSSDYLEKIVRSIEGINPMWLLTGDGEMFLKPEQKNSTNPYPALDPAAAVNEPELKILPITIDDQGEENIVLVNTKAQAGYPTLFLEPEFYQELPTIKIPSADYRNGTFRAFEVNKDSMSPTLHHGAIVIGRYEDDWEKGSISEGYIYVVVTREHVLVKRVMNRLDRGELYLMSDNEDYEGYPEPVENVLQLWRVAGGIINKFPNTRFEWRKKMSHMEADIHELRKLVINLQKRLPPEGN